MATQISSLISQARIHLNETSANFWTDAELISHANNGIKDLWRRLNDLYQEYFVTMDITNVSMTSGTNQMTGVPADLFRVVAIEPRVLGDNNPNPGLIFKPRRYNDPDFTTARARSPIEPKNAVIFYALMQQGAPVAAPVIYFAPQVTDTALLRVLYNQTLATVSGSDPNPIPGESDNAIIAWIVAYARARETDPASPDPEWIALYGTEKTNLIQQLTPRSIQEPEHAEAIFETLWPDWQ